MEYTEDTYGFLNSLKAGQFRTVDDGLECTLLKAARFYDNCKRHRYHIISKYLKEQFEEADTIMYFLSNIETLCVYLRGKIKDDSISQLLKQYNYKLDGNDLLLNLNKLYDHIALEEERMIANAEIVRKSVEEAGYRLEVRYNEVGNEFNEKTKSLSSEMNANAITIVGLFSAIIFVFFGGITALSGVIKEVLSVGSKADLALPMMLILIIALVLFDVVFLLLYSVSKIVNKNIGRTISGREYPIWYSDEYDEEYKRWTVFDYRIGADMEFDSKEGAKTYATSCRVQSRIRVGIINLFRALFIRFPHITIPNIIMIFMIIYLYFTA